MLARYRDDYEGEFVLTKTTFRGGKKIQDREWMDNPIKNQHVSGRAAVIGTDLDRERFDYARLQTHRGGLLGSKRLQTYGCGNTWKNLNFNFFAAIDQDTLTELQQSDYAKENIVYTSTRIALANPGLFYLIPHQPGLGDLALPVYLSAFDGHKEIFLLGYNNDITNSGNWAYEINEIIKTYNSCTFYLVGTESNMPTSWRHNQNVNCMNYRDFVSYCDI
jgi:hypothetical protein